MSEREKNQTQHIQNSAQNSTLIRNRTEHFQNSARGTNVSNNCTEQNTFKTVRKKSNVSKTLPEHI